MSDTDRTGLRPTLSTLVVGDDAHVSRQRRSEEVVLRQVPEVTMHQDDRNPGSPMVPDGEADAVRVDEKIGSHEDRPCH